MPNSKRLIIFNRDEVYKKAFPAIGKIEELEGGTNLLCQRLKNGELYCLGNNSFGRMSHAGMVAPLVLDPEKGMS